VSALTAGSGPRDGDEHHPYGLQSYERALWATRLPLPFYNLQRREPKKDWYTVNRRWRNAHNQAAENPEIEMETPKAKHEI